MGVIFCIIVGLLMMLEPVCDNDFFWHTVVGNWVLKNKTIPDHELFSWYGSYSWTAHEWLTESIMAKLGVVGCLSAMIIIFFLIYIIISKMLKLNYKKIFDFKLIYFLMLTIFFKVTGPRPYIISLLFFTYLIYILFNYLDKPEKYQKFILTIPILQILWVNLHGGSSSMSYIFLVGTLLCQLFSKMPIKIGRLEPTKLSKKQLKTLIIILILTILASLLNPFGIEMLKYPFTNMLDASMTNYITEWLSPSFHNFFGLYIFILVAFPLFNLILSKEKMTIHEIAFQLLMLYMALKSQRFIGMYAIYSTWNLGKYFFVTAYDYEIILKTFKKYQRLIGYTFSLILILGIFFIGYKKINYLSNNSLIDNDGFYSDGAIQKIIELQPKRLYNDYSQGGYLLYKLNEYNALNIKIFAYGLGDVFSKDVLPDTVNLQDLKTDPEKILNKYNFDYLLTTKDHTLHYYLEASSNYELIYSDEMCFIFQKNLAI